MNQKIDVRRAFKSWYVIRGNEHLRMGSWEDAIHLAKISDKPCNVMSEQQYKINYELVVLDNGRFVLGY